MKPHINPREWCAACSSFRPFALSLVLLPFTLVPGRLFAQQGWPQNPQYANGQSPQYSQPDPYAGQYAPNQQPAYGQQQVPVPDPAYDQGYPQQDYAQAQPAAQPLTAEQLEQLVAPIALYPDTLVAQILAAATYPAQVVGADHWLQSQGYASPDQIAYGADAQTWDPSVKALTAFPQVLTMMDRDLQWTTDLGNAYYNQPQDVLESIQVLRQRAQAAGTLQNTPQEAVTDNQGYIELAPPNPQVVYVPVYNPWDVYGQPVAPYPGFSLLGSLQSFAGFAPVRFGLGIAMSAFSHTPFGWSGWALNWLTQSVLFHQSNYYSHSTTVAHWNAPRGGSPQRTAMSRQMESYNRAPGNFARPARGFNGNSGYSGYNRAPEQTFARQPVRNPESYADNRPYAAYRSPAADRASLAENRDLVATNRAYSSFQGNYARPGYAYGNSPQAYANRPATPYASPRQAWRSPAPTPQRGDFAQRSYFGEGSNSGYGRSAYGNRAFAESPSRSEKSGGFHLFGNHNAERSYGGGHAPKSYGGGKEFKEHSHGGGHSSGHRSGGHRF
jgi:hypothetical protein